MPDPRRTLPDRIAAAVAAHYIHDAAGSVFATAGTAAAWLATARTLTGHALSDHCRRGLGSLRNGHTGLHDADLEAARGGEIGVGLQRLPDGTWVVLRSRRAELSPGDVATALDGRPLDAVLADLRHDVAASTDRSAAASLFFHPYLFPARFALTLADGRAVHVHRGADPLRPGRPRPEIALDRVGCAHRLTLRTLRPGAETKALTALRDLPGDAPLVIDLRWNGGGSTPMDLLARLHPGHFPHWRNRERDRAWGPDWFDGAEDGHRGPLAVLTGPLTASAAEDFAMALQWTGRATLIGEATAGSTGQPYMETVAPGLTFRVAAREARFPDGRPFESHGLAPDIPVAPTPDDIAAGRDPVLAAALARLGAAG
ncbi:MAG: S41 family peptidase [Pseudomonadota bacterium]